MHSQGGRPKGPPVFGRPVAQKALKLKKILRVSLSMEVSALKLSFGVSLKNVLYKYFMIISPQSRIRGPEYNSSEIRYFNESLIERKLCHGS